jgi:hypothetical protein
MKTLRFGIEIETVGLSREKLARAIHSVVGGTVADEYRSWRITDARGRRWQVVPDGSLAFVLLLIALLLPHQTGTAALDVLHTGAEHALTYFWR